MGIRAEPTWPSQVYDRIFPLGDHGQMNESLATLDNESLELRRTVPYVPSNDTVTRGKAMRFSYACGDRPLEGYEIKRGIGLGGFGDVYFALSDAGKEVALKRIQRHIDIEMRGVSQCLNLKHVNLISLWDIRTDSQGNAWVVMEYIPGGSLRDVIEKSPSGMELSDVDAWFQGIASGVRYLHNNGIVHRDLKPGNIFWDDDTEVVKIGDYGLSKLMSRGRLSGQTESVGTFHYMAPEIGRGVYGREIDLYALGVIVYEMLTGTVPFDGESSQEIIMKHLTANPDLSKLPPAFSQFVEKALCKDPDRRYQHVDAMLADFKKCLKDPGNDQIITLTEPVSASTQPTSLSDEDTSELLYIHDEAPMEIPGDDNSGMMFGDLREIVDAVPIEDWPANSPSVVNEPIARSVQQQWRQFAGWWNHGNVSTPIKIVILVVSGIVLLVNSSWIIPLAITLAVFYGLYLGGRLLLHAVRGTAQNVVQRKQQLSMIKAAWQVQSKTQTRGRRAGDLMGAFVVSGLLAPCLLLLAQAVSNSEAIGTSASLAFLTWLTSVTVISSWSLLAAGKLWERQEGDPVRRRFSMVVLGISVGMVSYFISQYFLLDMESNRSGAHEYITELPRAMSGSNGNPYLAAHVIFFAAVFGLFRWWKQVDPSRRTRLSFWSIGCALLGATVVNELAGFPFPWMTVMVGVISVNVQLASPWLSHAERGKLLSSA